MSIGTLVTKASLMTPDRVVKPSNWVGHVPFASWIVEQCRPDVFVELGTHTGNSYFSFCQSVASNNLSTRCFAVDTWQGDEHSGHYDENVHVAVSAYNQKHYGGFSRLLRMTFDSALGHFEDGSVDILHMDGLHTYKAVRHDFANWLAKLSPRGVLLLHDTAVRDGSFGVWRLFGEAAKKYRSIEFAHSSGLGVLFIGEKQPPAVLALLEDWAEPATRGMIIRFFETLGTCLQRQSELDDVNKDLNERLGGVSAALADCERRLINLNNYAMARDQIVGERDAAIVAMNRAIADRDVQIYNFHVAHGSQVTELQQVIAEQENRIDRLNHVEIAYLQLKSSRLIRLRDAFNEGSWRPAKLAKVCYLMGSLIMPSPLKKALRPLLMRSGADRPSTVAARARTEPTRPGRHDGRDVAGVAVKAISQNPEFDEDFYLKHYPDVGLSGMQPYDHYVRHGKAEGRLARMANPEVLGSFSELATDRETILVINHEGWVTGAPVLGYNLIKEMLKKYNVVALFLAKGPLIEACRALGAIVVGPVTFPLIRSVLPARLTLKLITDHIPLKFAIANSVESRYMLEALADSFIPNVSLIHEFAANVLPDLDAFREAIFWSGEAIFSSALTRDNVLTMYPDLRSSGRSYPILPQGRCSLPDWTDVASRKEGRGLAAIRSAMQPAGFPRDGIVVLGVGGVQIRKGVDLFVDCATHLRRKASGLAFRFVWIGKGYAPDTDMTYSAFIADQIVRAGLEDCVCIVDEVDDLEVAYDLADVLLITSRLDPLPNVAIDALAEGLPLVCFDKTTGIADILHERGLANWCVAEYLNTEDMAIKVLAFAESVHLRSTVGAQGREVAVDMFNMDTYVNQLEHLLANEGRRSQQEREDVETISQSDLIRLDYFLPPNIKAKTQTREDAIRGYVRSWQSGVGRRKLFPGFRPSIYHEEHGMQTPYADPLADYLRAGQPQGPWNYELITADEEPLSVSPRLRVALHIHVYYVELLSQILERLALNRIRPVLLITVPNEATRQEVAFRLSRHPEEVDIRIVPNRGRDIAPFLTELGETVFGKYDLVGHVHTKKTSDLKDQSVGADWFKFLLENLIGGQRPMIDIILGRMARDARVGIVFPDDPNVIGWDSNFAVAKVLPMGSQLDARAQDIPFPVGTMFWTRPAALAKLFELRLQWSDYPAEPLPRDGTLLHALERLFGAVATQSGYSILRTNVFGVSR